jgi:uncharacterized protein (DUF924 family)
MEPDPRQVLEFWFGAQEDGFSSDECRARWFSGGTAFDEEIRAAFGGAPDDALNGAIDHWLAEPRSRLAFIIVCDQFPRNLYRGEQRAFATDALALAAAGRGIETRADLELSFDERAFFYLPFEHSESLLDQHTCVGLFSALRDGTPEGNRHHTGGYLRHAHQHRDIIARFGRFPHRNATLERNSTPEEAAFLVDSPAFGQAKTADS